MPVVTISDMIDYEDMAEFEDATVTRVLKNDVILRLNHFKDDPTTGMLLGAMLLVLQYYMPEEDYKDWYRTIQNKL
jgi:hypothetical protein